MKKLITLIAIVGFAMTALAQAPQKMSYQAIIRNTSGGLVMNTSVGMKISILQGSAQGTAVFVETFGPTTDANGLVTLEIGTGTPVTGTFSAINWASGTYFIKTATDISGGTNYTITGTSQLMSVPYALNAKTAETATSLATPAVPIGTILPFAGTTLPAGFKWCDGTAISRTANAALFAVIGNYWGSGDGLTTFNLPDMRGRFMRGVDGLAGNDPDKDARIASNTGGNTGNVVGSAQADEIKSHHHSAPNGGTFVTYGGSGCSSTAPGGGNVNAANSTSATTDSGSNETRPKNVYVNYIIKI